MNSAEAEEKKKMVKPFLSATPDSPPDSDEEDVVELTTATLFCVYIGVKFLPFIEHSELNPDSFLGTIRTRFRNNANRVTQPFI